MVERVVSNFYLFLFLFVLKTETYFPKMESVQRRSTEMEGENTFEQRHLEMLAHAM